MLKILLLKFSHYDETARSEGDKSETKNTRYTITHNEFMIQVGNRFVPWINQTILICLYLPWPKLFLENLKGHPKLISEMALLKRTIQASQHLVSNHVDIMGKVNTWITAWNWLCSKPTFTKLQNVSLKEHLPSDTYTWTVAGLVFAALHV